MTTSAYCIDIKKMCDIKGPLHASFLDTNNVFVACNKLKLDFCRDIYGTEDIIGNTPGSLLNDENLAMIAGCCHENTEIIETKLPKQFYHTWIIKGLYRLDLLTLKMPIFSASGDILGVFAISHFINKFSAQKAFALGLSKREAECLFYLFEGYTAKEIARAIELSPRTIEGYIDNMKDKLGCSTISELLLITMQSEIKEGLESTLVNRSLYLPNPLSECIKTSNTFNSIPINLA